MGKQAITINEQILKLKERGVDVTGFTDQKLKEILLDVGYYRLGFYWFDLKKKSNSNFVDGTKFQTILDLYYIDSDIRYILIKYLNRIEVNFRTNLVYYVSNKYKHNPIWFIDEKVMYEQFIRNFSKHYNQVFIKKHAVLKNHHIKYPADKFAPAWKTFENFPFGTIFKTFESIKDNQIKERISENLGIKPIPKFEKIFKGLVHVRNRCAHGAILYNFYLPKSLPTIPSIQYLDDKRNNLDVIIKTIVFVLEHISINRKNDFMQEINICLSNLKENNREAFEIYTKKSGLQLD